MADDDEPRFPTTGGRKLHPIPDLKRIPPDQWRAALEATHPSVRQYAVRTAMGIDLASGARADALVAEIGREERATRDRAAEVAAWPRRLPRPDVGAPPRRSQPRQVNFRLCDAEHAELVRAGELLGLRATQVARLLTLRGVHQILREAEP